jgi:hypothetical protein
VASQYEGPPNNEIFLTYNNLTSSVNPKVPLTLKPNNNKINSVLNFTKLKLKTLLILFLFIFSLSGTFGFIRSRGSSVSIMSDYGLDDPAIRVRYPARAKDFSCNLCVQTGSEAHPASYTMGTGGPFPEAKSGRGVTLTTHPHLVPRSRMSRRYTSSPPKRHVACSGTALPFF